MQIENVPILFLTLDLNHLYEMYEELHIFD